MEKGFVTFDFVPQLITAGIAEGPQQVTLYSLFLIKVIISRY